MRSLFGLVGILVVLAIVGVLMKKQLGSTQQAIPALQLPATAGGPATPAASPQAPLKDQSQQIQQQYKQAVESALQQARPMPDDK